MNTRIRNVVISCISVPLLSMLLLGATTGGATAEDWELYLNSRFGAQVEVPVDGFTALPPPTNGDGLGWISADGLGEISVYGTFGGGPISWDEYRKTALVGFKDGGLRVTYESGGNNWLVVSGRSADRIGYMKAVRSQHCEHFVANHIYLEYPVDQKARFDPIVERMSKSLTSTPSIACS